MKCLHLIFSNASVVSDLNIRDNRGNTPLHIAVEHQSLEAVEFFMQWWALEYRIHYLILFDCSTHSWSSLCFDDSQMWRKVLEETKTFRVTKTIPMAGKTAPCLALKCILKLSLKEISKLKFLNRCDIVMSLWWFEEIMNLLWYTYGKKSSQLTW